MLSLLPPYEGKSILELGAGIGRFTGELAQKADSVIALAFIEDVIKMVIEAQQPDRNYLDCYFIMDLTRFFPLDISLFAE